MKNFKPSKFLLVLIGVVSLTGAFVAPSAQVISGARHNQSVRDMMIRRHNYTRYGTANSALPKYKAPEYSLSSRFSPAPMPADKPIMQYAMRDKDGSLFPGGDCKSCHKSGPIFDTGSCERCYNKGPLIDTGPCEKCKEPTPEPIMACPALPCCEVQFEPTMACPEIFEPQPEIVPVYAPEPKNCCDMAPLYLEHVDFNLTDMSNKPTHKLGDYRFRIFGCRRYNKEAILNQGRIFEKDMNFSKVFENVTGECYNIIKKPADLCLQQTPSVLPEYVLTAEITDFYMNICDGYDWKNATKTEKRSGSSEMTVHWRLTNLSKTKVLFEGTTTGYARLNVGEENGEIALIEAAFADAVRELQALRGFEDQLMIRLSPEEMAAERNALIAEEIALDPAKCHYAEPLRQVKQCEISRKDFNIRECPAFAQNVELSCDMQPEKCVEIETAVVEQCLQEPSENCAVVDDTWVETQVQVVDDLCIVAHEPYDVLTPENLYKLRASVVEISNLRGQKGAGLIVSDTFVLTSASLIGEQENTYKIRTINGKEFTARAVRINLSKNIALLTLDTPTEYTPLPLNLDLPKVGQTGFMTLGLLDVEAFDNGTENYIDNHASIMGYRYSEDKGAEIIADTKRQDLTIGSILIDAHGSVDGVAHIGLKTQDGQDLFLPTETVLRSVGLKICECVYDAPSPWQQTVYKPVTELILHAEPKAPEQMPEKARK